MRDAVFGNAGSLIAFRVGGADGEVLEKAFNSDQMRRRNFLDLKKHEVIASIPDGSAAPIPFLGSTLAPLSLQAGRKDAIIALSREKFARPRNTVESRILKLFADTHEGKSPPVKVGVALRNFRRHTARR